MPDRFMQKWLAFDAQRPAPKRLAWRFVLSVALMLVVAATLAILTGR